MILTIEDYLADRLHWEPTRRNSSKMLGRCPFHSPDVNPSFSIVMPTPDPDSHFFRCHSLTCGVSGSGLYGIVRVHLFGGEDRQEEIMRILDELRGKSEKSPSVAPIPPSFSSSRELYSVAREPSCDELAVMTATFSWWRNALFGNGQHAREARVYLQERGLALDFVQSCQTVGYAPYMSPSYSTYKSFCYALEERCGPAGKSIAQDLGILNEQERVCFQHRLIFAQRNTEGQVISFQGRTLQTETDGRETAKFLMPRHLKKPMYSLPVAKPYMPGTVHLESYIGCLAISQPRASYSGMENAALLGTNTQFKFEQFRGPQYLCYDHDLLKYSSVHGCYVRAGDELAKKAILYCEQRGLHAKRVRVPLHDKDVDRFLLYHSIWELIDLLLTYDEQQEEFYYGDIAL